MLEVLIFGMALALPGTISFIGEMVEGRDQRVMVNIATLVGAVVNAALCVVTVVGFRLTGIEGVVLHRVVPHSLIYHLVATIVLLVLATVAYLVGTLVANILARRLVERFAPFWAEQE